jgi:very-short-patch-repair endonuclease
MCSEYTREEEYSIADKLQKIHNCKIIKNELPPYTLFLAKDIGRITKLKNIRTTIQFYTDTMAKIIKYKTNGGIQNCKFLTFLGLLRLFVSFRNCHEVISTINSVGIEIHRIKFTCIESDSIGFIQKTFRGEKMVEQFRVNNYSIDLYFPDYKLAIECDEKHHNSRRESDKIRENFIKNELQCHFIRYSPEKKDFDMSVTLNEIYTYIKNYNS